MKESVYELMNQSMDESILQRINSAFILQLASHLALHRLLRAHSLGRSDALILLLDSLHAGSRSRSDDP